MTLAQDAADTAALVPAPARPLKANAGAAYLGTLLSIAVIGAGAVGIRDGALAAGWITGSSWTDAAVGWIDGLEYAGWMTFAGVAAIVIGVVFVALALAPRRKTALEMTGRSSVVITHSDVARAAASAAKAVPGVVDARVTSSGRRLRVDTKTTTGKDGEAGVREAVTDAVSHTLQMLSAPPRIVVRIHTVGDSR